jgi:hypothetical protein
MKKKEEEKKPKKKSVYANYNDHILQCYLISKDKYFLKQLIRNFLTLKVLPYSLVLIIVGFLIRLYFSFKEFRIFLNKNLEILPQNIHSFVTKLEFHPALLTNDIKRFIYFSLVIFLLILAIYIYYLYSRKTAQVFKIFDKNFKRFSGNEDGFYKYYFIKTPKGLLMSVKESTVSSIKKDSTFWEKVKMSPGEYIEDDKKDLVFFKRGFALPDKIVY